MGVGISKSSHTGPVGHRHEKPWWDRSRNFVRGVYFIIIIIIFNCCATPNGDLLFSMMKGASLQKKNTSRAESESLWENEAWNTWAVRFVMVQF